MAENGVKINDLDESTLLDNVIGNRLGSTFLVPLKALAKQILSSEEFAGAIAQTVLNRLATNQNATTAQTAANVAMAAGWVYENTADAEAVRSDDDYVWIVSDSGTSVLDLYRIIAGTAVDQNKSTPSTENFKRFAVGNSEAYTHDFHDSRGALLLGLRTIDAHLMIAGLSGLSLQEKLAAIDNLIASGDEEFLLSVKDVDGKRVAMIDRSGRLLLGGIPASVQAMLNQSAADIATLESITVPPYAQPIPDPLYVDTAPNVVIGGGGHDDPLSVLVPSAARVGGRNWASWYQNDDIAGEGPGDYCVLAFSDDDWVTSTEYAYIVHPDPENCVFDPILWVDPLGKVWLFFCIMGNDEVQDNLGGAWAVTIKNPLAETPSISTPFRVSYYGVASFPTTINEQSILPVDYWRFVPLVPSESGKKLFRLFYEDRKIEPLTLLPENAGATTYDETNVVQLPDGSLLAVYRSRSSPTNQNIERVKGTIDLNGVVTWGEPETYTGLGLAASSRIWCGLTPTGRLAICYNNSANRNNLVVKLSDDYGETFPYSVQISNTLEVSYPVLTFDDVGNIYVTHDQNRITDRLILCGIVSEAAIVAGTATVTTRTIADKG